MLQTAKFSEQVPDALIHFPFLELIILGDKIFLAGRIDLFAESGETVDSYEVEIHPTKTYPNGFPKVYEVGGRIPRNIDWHVYPDGVCCLAVPIEEIIACRQGLTLTEFLKKYVCGFLFSQTFRRLNGYFYRERSHGFMGTVEYYKDILNLPTLSSVYKALQVATSEIKMKSNTKCFCGSHKKYRKCHRRRIRGLKKFAGDGINTNLQDLKNVVHSYINFSTKENQQFK